MSEIIPSIAVKHLTKSYGSFRALDNISFTVNPGEIVGFLGPNGAGKSTTMRILSGLMLADSGFAYICGIPVASETIRAQEHIGYMAENNPLPLDMRVEEYLTFRAELKGLKGGSIKKRVFEVMDLCDLTRKARKKIIGNLSKGFRQRVGIADAILAEPDVVIMDEPTIGLDPHQIVSIRKLIATLRNKMTVIISSHILAEIELCCDRVIIINHGQIVASGNIPELRRHFLPNSTYIISSRTEIPNAFSFFTQQEVPCESVTLLDRDDDGYYLYSIETKEEQSIGDKIFKAAHAGNIDLREIRRDEPNLEGIFLAATKRAWDETN